MHRTEVTEDTEGDWRSGGNRSRGHRDLRASTKRKREGIAQRSQRTQRGTGARAETARGDTESLRARTKHKEEKHRTEVTEEQRGTALGRKLLAGDSETCGRVRSAKRKGIAHKVTEEGNRRSDRGNRSRGTL